MTAPERAAVERVLSGCPEQALAADTWGAPTEVDHDIADPTEATAATAPAGSPGAATYESCDAARAAGAAPVRVGDAGYGSHLDGDGDGSACE